MTSEKSKHKSAAIAGIVGFVIGTVFGNGALWQFEQSKIARERESLDSASITTDLRGKENSLYDQIVILTAEYLKNEDQYQAHGGLPNPQINNEMLQQRIKLRMLKDDFGSLEDKLAAIENRPARDIPLDFVPPGAPPSLSGTFK